MSLPAGVVAMVRLNRKSATEPKLFKVHGQTDAWL